MVPPTEETVPETLSDEEVTPKQKTSYPKVKLVLGGVTLIVGLLVANLALFHWVERTGLHYLLGDYARYVCAYGGFAAVIFGAMLVNDFLVLRNGLKGKYVTDHGVTIFADVEKEEEKQTVAKRKHKKRKQAITAIPLVVLLFTLSPIAFSFVSFTATVTITPKIAPLDWFLNSDSKLYAPTMGSWQDIDLSGDADIPSGATGVILEIVNESPDTDYVGQVRAKGSTDDRTAGAKIKEKTQIMAFVKLDANRKFQAFRNSEDVKFYVRGYTGSDVTFFTSWNDVAGGHTAYNWYTVDVSGYGVPGDSIIILELYSHSSNTYAGLRFRRNGDTDYATYGQAGTAGAHQFIMIGVDADSKFQHRKSNNDYGNFHLIGYIENAGTWRASPSGDVSGTTTGVWTDIDITAETSSNAKVALFNVKCGWTSQQPKKADFRKNGSSDDQYVYGEHWYQNPASSIFYVVGLDENQNFETKIEASAINIYVIGYITKPSG